MKRRKHRKNNHVLKRTVVCCVTAGLFVSMLGIGYAAHTNVLTQDFHLRTNGMSFIFDSSEDVSIMLQKGLDGEQKELGGKASYDDKELVINDIGPISINDFMDGNAVITIEYAVKAEEDDKGLRRPAEVKDKEDTRYDLGTVELELLSHTPEWTLENGDLSMGSETSELSLAPEIIYQILPDQLCRFHVYNQLLPHIDEGVMCGTLVLKQESVPELADPMEIGLSSLSLPDKLCEEIKNGTQGISLEIAGNYGFSIPIDLDQFNTEE